MSKDNKKSPSKTKSYRSETEPSKSLIPEKYQNPLAVILLGLVLIVFFSSGIFSGSFYGSSDAISTASFEKYLDANGDFPLWQPYIFCGQPGFAAMMGAAERHWDVTITLVHYAGLILKTIFNSQTANMMIWYIILASGMYYLMRQHKQNKLISLFVSIAMILGTGVAIWVMIGHNSKPMTFASVPWIFFLIERIKERNSLLNAVVLTIAMHIMLAGGHVQMIFYAACAVGIYIIIDLLSRIIKKENWLAIVKLIGVFVVATGISFLMSADRYLSVLEYNQYSTRGSAPITERIDKGTTNVGGGKLTQKDYEYATMWSNSPDEVIDMFNPSYHGFGRVKYAGQLTNNQETRISMYWGQKPFEDATPYMGAVVLFLSLIGIFRYFKSNSFVMAMTITAIFALFLSFGYTFPILYDIFFYHFPKFSSFRAPTMALVLMHFSMPILAAFGLSALCEMREKFGSYKQLSKGSRLPINVFFIAVLLFFVIGIIFAMGFESSYIMTVTNSPLRQYGEQAISMLAPVIFDNAVSDWMVIAVLCLVTAGLVYSFINKKLAANSFFIAVIFIVVIDLWRVSYRAIDVVDKQVETTPFQRTDIIDYIKNEQKETGERYRICDMSSQVMNANAYYFIENTNGYFPAKLRTFQDMLDVLCDGSTSVVSNPFLWNLMNAKYIITSQKLGTNIDPFLQSKQTGAYVYYNSSYCRRAFFVDSVKVADDWTILNNIKENNFNPKIVAYLEKELDKEITPSYNYVAELNELEKMIQQEDSTFKFSDTSIKNRNEFAPIAKIIDYKNEFIKIETETKGQHLLVLSEMYYPIGWKAFIDGQETEIYKTDFAFRSIVVPSGKHSVEFRFHSDKFELGRMLSAASNIVVIIGIILGVIIERKRKTKININTPSNNSAN